MSHRIAICLIALFLGACGGGGAGGNKNAEPPAPKPPVPTVGSVTITGPATLLATGSSMPLTATVRDPSGAEMSGQTIVWTSTNSSVLSVTGDGVVSAVAAGTANISAAAGGVTGSLELSVNRINSAVLAAPTSAIQPGSSLQLRMLAKDDQQRDIYFTVTGWTSSAPTVASVSDTGRVDGLSAGLAWITAHVGSSQTRMLVSVHSPIRNNIAFVSVRGPMVGYPPQPNGGIYVMNADGSDQRLLIESELDPCSPNPPFQDMCPKHLGKPAWDPEGMRLATWATLMYEPEWDAPLILVCGTGGHPYSCNTIAPFPRPAWPYFPPSVHPAIGTHPAWSPDGRRLMYWGGTWTPETYTFTSGARHATWSPDGTRVAFVRETDGNNDVWIRYVDDSSQPAVRLTDAPGDDDSPQWSRDGGSIAFVSNRDGNPEIYVMAANGDAQRNLTNNAAEDLSPTWSPDSSLIAFETNRDGNREIYVMGLDGTSATNLTNNAAEDTQPAWSP